ncbi:uncharacterized protein LOC120800437 [Xiphias gladius]|uniref:uncharacterized protein LOC120800437 n=1 Tax=Xiphias gladius TaxID=8245 RepID=UPI001A97DAFA|nr:uncharacterized protein LOC120800437 [Xiphias gladius]
MEHQKTDMDVESLRRSGRRGSCLDACLVMSVAFLFAAVTAVAAGGAMVAMDLQSKVKPPLQPLEYEKSQLAGPTVYPRYKMQNFAYLKANSSELKNSTMHWAPVYYGAGMSVGSNFLFNPEQQSLKPERSGMYFMYIDLNFTCTYTCEAGLLSVSVGSKLTCEVELPVSNSSTPVSKKCWAVTQMDGEKLFTQMTVPEKGLQHWKLTLETSGFGMFLVD